MRLLWEGLFFNHASLALVNRELAKRIQGMPGVDLEVLPLAPPEFEPADDLERELLQRIGGKKEYDIHLRHFWPPAFTNALGSALVIIQPWEFGSLPVDWIAPLKRLVRQVWVPSRFVQETYLRSGISLAQLRIIPNGVDTNLLRPDGPRLPLPDEDRFRFAFVGGTIARKGIDLLLEAYTREFRPDEGVSLIIKDFGGRTFYRGATADALIARYRSDGTHPPIHHLTDDLSSSEMAAFYRSIDCLVQPYRGEGFGLPIAEAMATGKPVIVTNFGAALDFVSETEGYLIDARLVRAPSRRVGPYETVDFPVWAEPDLDSLRLHMRRAFENPAEAANRGQAGREQIARNFTWEKAAQLAMAALTSL